MVVRIALGVQISFYKIGKIQPSVGYFRIPRISEWIISHQVFFNSNTSSKFLSQRLEKNSFSFQAQFSSCISSYNILQQQAQNLDLPGTSLSFPMTPNSSKFGCVLAFPFTDQISTLNRSIILSSLFYFTCSQTGSLPPTFSSQYLPIFAH